MTKRERWEAAEARRKEKRAHTWFHLKRFPWRGAISLRNKVTERAMRRPCPSWD